MYSDDEKRQLMEDLKEMESLKVDVGDEGVILQDDLIHYFESGEGDVNDLETRLELYLYEFNIFLRKSPKLSHSDIIAYLNDTKIDLEQLELVKKDLNKFEISISPELDNGKSQLNLNFIFRF